jgi:ribosome recycling factor
MASDPSRRDNYFTKELPSNIRQVMNTIKKSKTDPTVTDDALKSFYNELQIFNSKNPNDLIPIDEITDMIENSK